VNYLLDTNACIALLNGTSAAVRMNFEGAVLSGSSIAVSSVVAFELWYGVAKSSRKDTNRIRLENFFAGPLDVLAFGEEDARMAGEIRATLEAAGTPIGAYDLLIAGQAVQRDLTLVTANVAEFSRVPGLVWVDWALSTP
jgi:tRNA(fMet)-specific endonuclease VapC